MNELHVDSVVRSGEELLDTAITDLFVMPVPGGSGQLLYAATGRSGGISCYRLREGHAPELLDSRLHAGPSANTINGRLHPVMLDDRLRLIAGDAQDQLTSYAIGDTGTLEARTQIHAPMAANARTSAIQHAGDTGFVYLADSNGDTLVGYLETAGGALRVASRLHDDAEHHLADVTAMASLSICGRTWLFAGSGIEHGIDSYRVNPASGALDLRGSIGAADGLGMTVPTAIATTSMGGTGYAIVATAGGTPTSTTGTLSVLRVSTAGALTATDHVIDTRETRFGQVQSLEIAKVGTRTFVLAGGGDDGVSLLTLLPDGRLLHLDTLADTDTSGLSNITALAATPLGGGVQIVAASQSEPGLTVLSLDTGHPGRTIRADRKGGIREAGSRDDILLGGTGSDRLRGNGGDDILIDGGGKDTLTGGPGDDIFVLRADGERDRIDDFQPGHDTLDLSDYPFFYDPEGLEYRADRHGAILQWREERIELRRSDGGAISEAEARGAIRTCPDRPDLGLGQEDMRVPRPNPDRPAPDPVPETPEPSRPGPDQPDPDPVPDAPGGSGDIRMTGHRGADVMDGGDANDRLDGAAGDDSITGGGGADTLLGGKGDDMITGDGGNDRIAGGPGRDNLKGGTGADTINGGDGGDTLGGGDSDDFIFGGNSAADKRDVIYGGAGNDSIDAGYGNDLVYGMDGNDSIAGGFGVDTLQGQDGDDVITGSAFSDLVFGGPGDDFVNGGFGCDRVNGGPGADRFFHTGALGHGTDWIQDYSAAEGDMLRYGAAGDASDFRLTTADASGAGRDHVDEAFIRHRPTGLILWVLIDGASQDAIRLQTADHTFDLLA